jgi:hypothetical protein
MSDDMKSMGEVMKEMGIKHKAPRVYTDQDWRNIEQAHWERHKQNRFAILRSKGVPEKHVALLEANHLEESPAVLAVEAWLRAQTPDKQMLVLVGEPQEPGKSLACAYGLSSMSVVRRTQYGNEPWLNYRYPDSDYEWVTASELGALRDRFDNDVRMKARRLETCGVLVLDELGGPTWTDVSKQLEELLGKRWSSNKRTMITTNLSIEALRHEVDERLLDRIRRVGRIVICGPWKQSPRNP